ncbi:protein amnionless [Drosophila sechellia]|uniref:Protein amnionless n=1 Tax=Drosophila sechellia TaxID=7238 RepID=B4ICU9_DROSE|nr:protein amnionless [Drosophila sechellia]EDW45375.1 GM16681 [Drosophila sechellia]
MCLHWRWLIWALVWLQVALATKWYGGGMDFNDPSAWLDDHLPCAQDLVVFPEYYPALLPLPEDISIDGLVFPREGAILLAEESTITFGSDKQPSCESEEKKAYLKPPKSSKWFDPGTWTDKSKKFSTFTPELERIPCDDEQVIIKGHGPLSFDLENVQYLRLGQLILAGSSISKTYLEQLISRDLGQFLFYNAEYVQVEYYRGELCGCHKDFERLLEPVCHNVQEQCETPHCLSPVRPLGSCCLICGAILSTPTSHCTEGTRKEFVAQISNLISQESLKDQIGLHVDFVGSQQFGNFLQAVITDRHKYSERSLEFLQQNEHNWNKTGTTLKVSGRPYNPNVSFSSIVLILFCMALVGLVSVVILAHFMPENPYLNRIPQWIHDPRRWRWRHLGLRLRRNLLFNRFDNVGAGGGSSEGGASGVDRLGIMAYDPESGEVRERAFDNPMFEQRGALEEAAKESQEQEEIPKMETGDLDATSVVDEQELTEINLEVCGVDTDEETI